MTRKRPEKPLPMGFTCSKCRTPHEFPAYVFAHRDDELLHQCDCGAKHVILRGKAELEVDQDDQ